MQNLNQKCFKNKTLIVLILIFSLLSIYTYMNLIRNNAFVQIDVRSNISTNFKIYWAGENQEYSEKRISVVRINHVQSKYTFSLTDLRYIKKLRIDPADSTNKTARILIKSILIKQIGYIPIRFSTVDEFKQMTAAHGIKEMHNHRNGLFIVSSGSDPQLEVYINPTVKKIAYHIEIMRLIFMVVLLAVFFSFVANVSEKYNYVPYFMVFVAALILIMACISKVKTHPDEYVHVNAAAYYQDHWLPPEVCAPGTEHTYSVYGFSRLNSLEIVYLVAGKFSKCFSFLPIQTCFRLRLFNFFLFFILLFLSFINVEYRIVSIPLLISPQIWYVFSYFNSDAFSLFILFIISYQVLIKNSLLNRFLVEPGNKRVIIHGILWGILFSLLFFIKKNYYIFIIFLLLYFVWRLYIKEFFNPKMAIKRVGLIILVAASIFGLRYFADIYANGFQKSEKLLECREKLARSIYKPSTRLKNKHPWLQLRDRGVSLKNMFVRYRWGGRSFKSSFGVYEYMTISAPKSYYDFIRLITIFIILFIVFSLLFKAGIKENMLLLIVFTCSFLLIWACLWRSWVTMLQAQGRYFLPIVAMFGFLFYQVEWHLNKPIFNTFIILMFLLSLYSFVFIGLVNIPKF